VSWVELLSESNVVAFMLLFFRFAALFIAVPIFSHKNIPVKIKVAMAFVFTIVFYSSMPELTMQVTLPNIFLAILSEFLFGLVIGLILLLAFNVITFAGGQISFMMGFSMASAIDPQSGISMPIISQFLSLIALMVLLELDMHHWILVYIDKSISEIPLGGFLMTQDIYNYMIHATSNMFLVGFMIAFPIIALVLLSDVIFGMLMKTMPQFNLLVIGFPIKIMLSLGVIIATLTATMLIVKMQMIDAFNALAMFF
jgi:flagellar biosynthetic protein FliR